MSKKPLNQSQQWTKYPLKRLGEVGVKLYDCDHRTPKPTKFGYPYIAIPQIQQGRLDLSEVRRISKDDYESWIQRNKPQAGDIIVTRRARVGDTAVIPPGLECAIGQNLVILRSDGTQVDQSFLRWALRGPFYEQEMSKFLNVGAVFDSLNCGDIPKFELPIPPLPIQRRIAHILSSLDEKIDLNRNINKKLDTMARILFQSWFADFDPVWAKMEGRLPEGMNAATAALFPSEFENIGGIELPKGWKISTIGESVTVQGGSTPSTSNPEYWDNGVINFATPKDLASLNSPVLLSTEKKITTKGVEQISSRILPIGTVLLSSRAPIGYIAITALPVAINQGFIAIICNKFLPSYYVINWLESNLQSIIGRANGTTFLEISKSNFKPMNLVIPSENVLNKYTLIVAPIYQKIINNEKESCRLALIRDSLLPKLMSGEIPVKM